jgi:hypothetical protein
MLEGFFLVPKAKHGAAKLVTYGRLTTPLDTNCRTLLFGIAELWFEMSSFSNNLI